MRCVVEMPMVDGTYAMASKSSSRSMEEEFEERSAENASAVAVGSACSQLRSILERRERRSDPVVVHISLQFP